MLPVWPRRERAYGRRATASHTPGPLASEAADNWRLPIPAARARCLRRKPARSAFQNPLPQRLPFVPRLPRFVIVHVPAKILRCRLVNSWCDVGEVRSHVMFEPVLTDVAQQLLHRGNLDHASAAKRIQRIVGECAFTDISAQPARSVIR